MTDIDLLEEDINDFCDDMVLGLRAGSNLATVVRKLKRRFPGSEKAISLAELRIQQSLHSAKDIDDLVQIVNPEVKQDWYTGSRSSLDVYWPPLREKIEADLGKAIESIDSTSDGVLNSLVPASTESYRLKGLVVGYVQSGKTTNFMSVIAKAADVGYRLIIVLTGMTENLRVQTQSRLEQQLIDVHKGKWHRLTTTEHDFWGDDNPQALKDPQQRFIAVVKKNSTRLRRLNEWIAQAGELGNRCPILVIDDEADQASIDVSPRGKQLRSAINEQITKLLDHDRTVYIAYTATPYANILINPNNDLDLYPSSFIKVLPKPESYFGAEALFGREALRGEDIEDVEDFGIDMVRIVPDEEVANIKPPTRSSAAASFSPELGDELQRAIHWFILATAARWARGQQNKHSSMLVHTSMLTIAHDSLRSIIDQELNRIKAQFDKTDEILETWKAQWESESKRVPSSDFGLESVTFEELTKHLPRVLEKIRTITDNASSDDRLNYDSGTEVVIAIGGNTLSRGLTLEGLVSSYFVRQATAYDTLLQMGRWFGFRNGYQDLPRIWMPQELYDWFRDLALVEADLRQELAIFEVDGITPMQVQTKIRKHPAMSITSRAKMQDAYHGPISLSGKRVQTINFRIKDEAWLNHNIEATRSFVSELKQKGFAQDQGAPGTVVYRSVPTSLVLEFLKNYKFHETNSLAGPYGKELINYIASENNAKALTTWNISFFGQTRNTPSQTDLGLGFPLNAVRRSRLRRRGNVDPNNASIGALVGSLDRMNDIPLKGEARAEFMQSMREKTEETGKYEAVQLQARQEYFGSNVGHLGIYLLDRNQEPVNEDAEHENKPSWREPLNAVNDVIGICAFLPQSVNPDSGIEAEYVTPLPVEENLAEIYAEASSEYESAEAEDQKKLEEETVAKPKSD